MRRGEYLCSFIEEKKGPHINPSGKMEPCAIIWWLAIYRPHKKLPSPKLQHENDTNKRKRIIQLKKKKIILIPSTIISLLYYRLIL